MKAIMFLAALLTLAALPTASQTITIRVDHTALDTGYPNTCSVRVVDTGKRVGAILAFRRADDKSRPINPNLGVYSIYASTADAKDVRIEKCLVKFTAKGSITYTGQKAIPVIVDVTADADKNHVSFVCKDASGKVLESVSGNILSGKPSLRCTP